MIILGLKLLVGLFLFVGISWFLDQRFNKKLVTLGLQMQLANLGLFSVYQAIFSLLVVAGSYFLAMSGMLTGFSELFDQQGSAPSFVLWLIEPTFFALMGISVLGLLIGFISSSFGFSVLLVTSLLFPSLISAPGAALIIFCEMLGHTLRVYLKPGHLITKSALGLWLGISLVVVLAFWAGGGVIREGLHQLNLNPMELHDRFLEVFALDALLVVLQTGILMMSFHFYYRCSLKAAKGHLS